MPETIFVFSDMEFSAAQAREESLQTDYQIIKAKFEKEGYTMPALVFWNLKGKPNNTSGRRSKPVEKGESKVTMVSGYSGKMMRHFLKNGIVSTPEDILDATLNDDFSHLKLDV